MFRREECHHKGIVLTIILCVTIIMTCSLTFASVESMGFPEDEQQLEAYLETKPAEAIVSEMNEADGQTSLIAHASALSDKFQTLSDEYVIANIK